MPNKNTLIEKYNKLLEKYRESNMALIEEFSANESIDIENLDAEIKELREQFEIAADSLPTLAEMRKISEMCRKSKCDNCPYLNKSIKKCRFVHGADYWDFGDVEKVR